MKRLALIAAAMILVGAAPAGACAADDTCLHDPLVAPVTGHLWLDGDGDGELDTAELEASKPGGVWADYNGDGTRQDREPGVPADADATFVLPVDTRRLAPGVDTVLVRWSSSHTIGNGFDPECLGGCVREVRVVAGQTTSGPKFPIVTVSTVRGTLWDDRNENGRREAGEDGLSGLRVFLDDNGNGKLDQGEPASLKTVPDGRYSLPVPTRYQVAGGTLPPLVVEQPAGYNCTAPADCAVTGLKTRSWQTTETDHGLARPVVIFTHGYGGSRIKCGDKELWFDWLGGPDLLNLRLGTDGQNLRDGVGGGTACSQSARVDGLVMDVAGSDIYGSSSRHFERIAAPGRHYDYVWDWRKDPSTGVTGLDELVERARREHGVAKVVLVGHSQGGLVMRHYIDDPSRAAKVSRAVTVGTPYWGAPKAILPLAAGIELPWFSPMDVMMSTSGLKAASRTLPGHFSLAPAFSYGPWLRVNGRQLTMDGVKDYLTAIGVDPEMYTRGAEQHGRVLDHFRDNGVDLHVIVGGGVPTIGRIGIEYGLLDELHVDWASGDETVPQRSAEHDAPADRLQLVCGLKHVPITADPQTTNLMDGFLIRGEKMPARRTDDCGWRAQELSIFHASDLTPMGRAAQARTQPRVIAGGRSMSLADAERGGHVQLIEFGGTTKLVATTGSDVRVELPAGGTAAVRELSDRGAGAERRFALTGAATVDLGGSGAVTNRAGKPLKPTAKDTRAPKTKASWRRGKLVLKAKDASKVAATFVVVGGKRRAYTKPLRLTAKQRKTATYGSVDVWGNVEKARRVQTVPGTV